MTLSEEGHQLSEGERQNANALDEIWHTCYFGLQENAASIDDHAQRCFLTHSPLTLKSRIMSSLQSMVSSKVAEKRTSVKNRLVVFLHVIAAQLHDLTRHSQFLFRQKFLREVP